MDTVLLAVKQTAEVIQEAEGGVRYLTSADFGGGGGGTIPANSTQIETSYGNALTTTAEWAIGDTLRRTRVLDLTTDPITEISLDWFNERTQLALVATPVIDTDVEIQTTSTVESGSGLATEFTLSQFKTLFSDSSIYGQVFTGMALYWNVDAKNTLLLDIKGSGTLATAPTLEYLRADGTWAELSTIDSTYTALTTSNDQFKKLDCSALQQVRVVFGTVTGTVYLRIRASVAKMSDTAGTGGGDASLAEQQTQTAHLAAIESNTASIGGSSEHGLHLTFNNIANCPVSPANSAAAWNTYFSTDVVQTATVVGNKVILVCNGNFNIGDTYQPASLTSIEDFSGYITKVGFNFLDNLLLDKVILNGLIHNDWSILADANYNFFSAPKLTKLINSSNATNKVFHLPEVEYLEDSFVYSSGGLTDFIIFEKLKTAKGTVLSYISTVNTLLVEEVTSVQVFARNLTNLRLLKASKLVEAGDNFLAGSSTLGAFIWYLNSLKSVGTGSFSGISGMTGTVYTNREFANNPLFQTFVAANTITVIITDLDRVEKTFTNPTLTTSETAGTWIAMDGYDTVELVLTMGTLTTAPSVALEVSYDGTNAVRCGTITGEQNLAKAISGIKANAKYMRYYVVTGGSSIGAGTSIKLFATKS